MVCMSVVCVFDPIPDHTSFVVILSCVMKNIYFYTLLSCRQVGLLLANDTKTFTFVCTWNCRGRCHSVCTAFSEYVSALWGRRVIYLKYHLPVTTCTQRSYIVPTVSIQRSHDAHTVSIQRPWCCYGAQNVAAVCSRRPHGAGTASIQRSHDTHSVYVFQSWYIIV